MGTKPNRKNISIKPAAAQKMRPAQPLNFQLVGSAYGAPTTIGNILRFARVESIGKNRWSVWARPLEWVLQPGHTVWMTRGGHLQCDCRQSVARHECDHVLAVRHLATIKPTRPADPRQIRLLEDTSPVVRIGIPPVRYRAEKTGKPLVHKMRAVPISERANG